MYLRPSTRVKCVAQSPTPGLALYLIVCNGAKDDKKCGEWIWVRPSEKSECPHCGHIYPSGYFDHAGPRTVEK